MGFFTGINKRSQVTAAPSGKNREINPLTCRYCGGVNFIGPCNFSPVGVHVALGVGDKCIYCGLNDYGFSCAFSPGYYPNKLGPHKHGHDGKRCIYCGLPFHPGRSCNFSPTGYHSL